MADDVTHRGNAEVALAMHVVNVPTERQTCKFAFNKRTVPMTSTGTTAAYEECKRKRIFDQYEKCIKSHKHN